MTGPNVSNQGPWYQGVSRYQWLVLLIASLGWIFDVFEGQIFVASMREAMPSLLPPELTADDRAGQISYYNNLALGFFLLGGAVGGVFFGMVSDRIGRTKTMVITILMYSLFTCVTAVARSPWEMIVLRFLVAMGVGGEWAVASAMVAEVMPARARAWSLGIFHASSVFGTYLAVAAGAFIIGSSEPIVIAGRSLDPWRVGFLIGAIPALLTVWIRWRLREPDKWVQARDAARSGAAKPVGRLGELFEGQLLRHTLVGVALAAIGLATFWGVHIYGKDFMRVAVEKSMEASAASDAVSGAVIWSAEENQVIKHWEMIGMFLVTTGGGLGLICFGPLSDRLGRRGAFLLYHLGGLVMALLLFQVFPRSSKEMYYVLLPVFGFLTLGMHAGYAVYFPELFPTRLRGSGAGFCFNMGRVIAAPILFLKGWMVKDKGFTPEGAGSLLSLLFLLGLVALFFAPETRGKELPE